MRQQDVADRIGVSNSAISGWETYRDRPDPKYAARLMKLFPQLTFADIYPEPAQRAA